MSGAGDHVIELFDNGILYIHVRKVWSAQEADDFFVELRPVHAEARRRHGRVLALAQLSTIQSPVVALRVRAHALEIKLPGDRNAMLVGTMLAKLQMGRLGSNEGFGLFTNRDQACAWLLSS